MKHQMGLYGEYFQAIRDGEKTVEVRLNDEKRRKISVGDTIEFIKVPEQDEKLQVQVRDLKRYDSFREMYADIPQAAFGCEDWTMQELLEGTYEIYTAEQEQRWGTVAIEMSLGRLKS